MLKTVFPPFNFIPKCHLEKTVMKVKHNITHYYRQLRISFGHPVLLQAAKGFIYTPCTFTGCSGVHLHALHFYIIATVSMETVIDCIIDSIPISYKSI